MIIGAGEAGKALVTEFTTSAYIHSRVCCLIDDNPNKWDRFIDGVPIVGGRDKIHESVDKYAVDEIIIAIPLGIVAAKKQYSGVDYFVTVMAMVCISMPTFFVATLLKSGGMENGAAVVAKIEAIAPGSTAARTVADVVITPIVLPLLQMLISVILFLLAYVVASILLRVLDVVAKLPLLKQLNHLLGLAAGALTGALWVVFLARLLFVLAWLGVAAWLSPEVLEGTWLASFANGLIPTFEV